MDQLSGQALKVAQIQARAVRMLAERVDAELNKGVQPTVQPGRVLHLLLSTLAHEVPVLQAMCSGHIRVERRL